MTLQNMTSSHNDVTDVIQEHIDKIVDSIESPLPNLYTLQAECVDCLRYILVLTNGELPVDDDKLARRISISAEDYYSTQEGILMHKFTNNKKNNCRLFSIIEQIFIPQLLRIEILQNMHNFLCYQGVARTYSLLQARYFWPKMYDNTKKIIESCDTCLCAKNTRNNKQPLHSIPTTDIGQIWCFD